MYLEERNNLFDYVMKKNKWSFVKGWKKAAQGWDVSYSALSGKDSEATDN